MDKLKKKKSYIKTNLIIDTNTKEERNLLFGEKLSLCELIT